MFSILQRIGKALMTPIAVLPVAALLLRLGFGDIPGINAQSAEILKGAGESIFAHLDLIFAIGIAYGLSKDSHGASALSGAIGVLVAKEVYGAIDDTIQTGVFVGIIMGVITAMLYNRFYRTQLPEFLAFFGGKRLVPILTTFTAIAVGGIIGVFWGYAQSAIDAFSHAIVSLEAFGTFLYGTLNRLLIPLGLHHILNSVFWFQLGEYTYLKEGVETVAHGDLHRFFAGDPSAGVYMSGFYAIMMFALPMMALGIWIATPKAQKKTTGALLLSGALASLLTGVTEPLEFLFIFTAPWLFVVHALLTGLALSMAHQLDIHAGFGFSAGLIDFIINYPLGTHVERLFALGALFGAIYFILGFAGVRYFKLRFESHEAQEKPSDNNQAYLQALGGKDNLVHVDACITRLRLKLNDNTLIDEEAWKRWGAKAIIRPDKHSAQIVLGAKAEVIAGYLKG